MELRSMSDEMRKNGKAALITFGDDQDMEDYVRALERRSGQQCDWGYSGGRAVVYTLGNIAKVTEAAAGLVWMEVAMQMTSVRDKYHTLDKDTITRISCEFGRRYNDRLRDLGLPAEESL